MSIGQCFLGSGILGLILVIVFAVAHHVPITFGLIIFGFFACAIAGVAGQIFRGIFSI